MKRGHGDTERSTPSPSDGQSEDRRERLVQTAIRLFSERPYSEVSVQDIASDAGVATGLLYYHFNDKQGLYVAGLELLAGRLRERIEAAADPAAPPLERLMAGLRAYIDFVVEHPTGYRELLRGAASQPQVAAIIERERRNRLEQMIEGLPDEVTPTAAVIATCEGWLHFVDGVQLAWLENGGLSGEHIADLCGRVLFASVIAAIQLEKERRDS